VITFGDLECFGGDMSLNGFLKLILCDFSRLNEDVRYDLC